LCSLSRWSIPFLDMKACLVPNNLHLSALTFLEKETNRSVQVYDGWFIIIGKTFLCLPSTSRLKRTYWNLLKKIGIWEKVRGEIWIHILATFKASFRKLFHDHSVSWQSFDTHEWWLIRSKYHPSGLETHRKMNSLTI